MKARITAEAVGRGITAVAPIVGISMTLTLFAVVGLAVTPAWAEVSTKLQKDRAIMEFPKQDEKISYLPPGGAQFLGPPAPEKAATNAGFRFMHTDQLHNGPNASTGEGGALMFNWTFGIRGSE